MNKQLIEGYKRLKENYKRLEDFYGELIHVERIKIFEYEEMLKEKQATYQRMPFFRKLLKKNKDDDLSNINEYITTSTNIINEKKETLEKEKRILINEYVINYINGDSYTLNEYHRKYNPKKKATLIYETAQKSYETGRSTIKYIYQLIEYINSFNGNHTINSEFNDNLNKAIIAIESFKKEVYYGVMQLKKIDTFKNISKWEDILTVLADDQSKQITQKDKKHKIITDVNASLAIITVAHNIVINEFNKCIHEYNHYNDNYNTFWNNIANIVESNIKSFESQL